MGIFFALLGLAQLADGRPVAAGSRIFGGCLLAAGVWFAWRGYRSATVIVERGRVVTRSFLRSSSYRTADLVGADVEVGQTGFNGFGREYLVLELADGSRRAFKELNARPTHPPEESTVVRRAAEAIGDEIRG
jgi:hypothetical protein